MKAQRSIFLPVGTLVNGNASATPVQVFESQLSNGMSVDVSTNVLVNTLNSASVFTVPAAIFGTNVNNAWDFIQQINNFLNSDHEGSFAPNALSSALAFISVNPNTATVAAGAGSFQIVGTGFLSASFADFFKVNDGAGGVNTISIVVNNDSLITMTGGFDSWFPEVGVYTIYYTLDGISFTTTGLSITVS